MNITPAGLMRAAGLSAAAAGVLYVLVQFIHPVETVAAVDTGAWATTHYLSMAMSVLGLVGVSGIYFRQIREAGLLGLIGYLMFSGFFLLAGAFQFVEAFILPELTDAAPGVVAELNGIFAGKDTGDLGAVVAVGPVAAVLYVFGGLLFALALVRTRILDRWASVLLAVATASTIAASAVPHSVARLFAIPVGVALVGLGLSLWRERSETVPALSLAVR